MHSVAFEPHAVWQSALETGVLVAPVPEDVCPDELAPDEPELLAVSEEQAAAMAIREEKKTTTRPRASGAGKLMDHTIVGRSALSAPRTGLPKWAARLGNPASRAALLR